ncbi:isochorismatase family protein, partial [Streptomyces sp. NPDC059134]|uniref:isochorismatase family protein n=1 Tax=Streptomyces sp. NPDC059134 TaxID=3346738 RepID=UPI00369F9554
MTATTLDPKTALVVVDLQKGIVGLPTVHPAEDVVARSAELAAAFRAKGLPVVLVRAVAAAPRPRARARARGPRRARGAASGGGRPAARAPPRPPPRPPPPPRPASRTPS